MAGKSAKAPARTPTGAKGSCSVTILRRLGVTMAGTSVTAGTGIAAAPRRGASAEGRVGTLATAGAGTTPGGGGSERETPGLRRTAARVLRRSALVESNPLLPAPEAGGLP